MNKQNHTAAPPRLQLSHTPGPWKAEYEEEDPRWRVYAPRDGGSDYLIARVSRYAQPDETGEANARLIAQAPTIADKAVELIDACPGACGCTPREQDSGHRVDCWRPRLDAAVDALADALRAAGRIP